MRSPRAPAWLALRAALSEAARGLWSAQVYRSIEHSLACYDSEVLQADARLAALFDHLARSGLQQKTLVVLTADHGEGLWQRAMPPSGKRPKGAFFPELYSSHGEYVYSERVHVPLVLRGPGFRAARPLAHEVSLLDVVPTILQRLDLPAPGELHGVALDVERAPERDPLVAYCAYMESLTEQGRWRLHLPYEDGGQRAPIESTTSRPIRSSCTRSRTPSAAMRCARASRSGSPSTPTRAPSCPRGRPRSS